MEEKKSVHAPGHLEISIIREISGGEDSIIEYKLWVKWALWPIQCRHEEFYDRGPFLFPFNEYKQKSVHVYLICNQPIRIALYVLYSSQADWISTALAIYPFSS